MKTLSIVVPIYRDGSLAAPFCNQLNELIRSDFFKERDVIEVEVTFVSDGIESDIVQLRACCDKYPFAKAVMLSRNFGQHVAITCGMDNSKGDYVAFTDVDLEDPLTALGDLVQALNSSDCEVAQGLRIGRKVSFGKKWISLLFHYFLKKLTRLDIPQNATTTRIMTRKYADYFAKMTERSRYIPGMEAWLGFKTTYVPITQSATTKETSSYSFKKRLDLATTAVLSFSDLPLRMAVSLGFWITAFSFFLGATIFIAKLFFIDFLPGFTTSVILISFFGGFQIFVTGVTGLYVGRILTEVQNRPLYVIKEVYGKKSDK